MRRSDRPDGSTDGGATGDGVSGGRTRDHELVERLRQLEVPEHGAGFLERLEERVEAEAAGREAGAPAAWRSAEKQRRSAEKRRRSWLRLAWIPIPLAAVILALLWAFAGPLGIDTFKPGPVGAAEITERAAAALADAKALKGTVVVQVLSEAPPSMGLVVESELIGVPLSSILTAEGDYRLVAEAGAAIGYSMAYDHRTDVLRVLAGSADGETFAFEATGLAVGPPDSYWYGYGDLGAAVRALRESPEAEVTENTYEDRSVWVLSTDLAQNLITGSGFDHVDVTVAKDVGLPVHIVYWMEGKPILDWSLSDLEVDPELPTDAFFLEIPPDIPADHVEHTDYGFRAIELAHLCTDGADAVGYVPVLPAEVPDGFVLAEVKMAEMGQPSGKEGMNPPGSGVVSAMYRRGFGRLIVSTRMVGDDPSAWSDPLASGEGYIDSPETVTLASGEFAGGSAEIVVNIRTMPHLWAMNDTLVVTITGDLTRDELLAVAESLAPVE